jgi:hypothetical protein
MLLGPLEENFPGFSLRPGKSIPEERYARRARGVLLAMLVERRNDYHNDRAECDTSPDWRDHGVGRKCGIRVVKERSQIS